MGLNILQFVLLGWPVSIALYVLGGEVLRMVRDYADGQEWREENTRQTKKKHRRIQPVSRAIHAGSAGVLSER